MGNGTLRGLKSERVNVSNQKTIVMEKSWTVVYLRVVQRVVLQIQRIHASQILWGTDPATGARQGQPWNPEKKEKHRKAEQKRFWVLDFKWFTLFVKLLKEKLENQGSRCVSFPRSAFVCLVGRPGQRRCRRQLGPLTWQWLQWEAQEI